MPSFPANKINKFCTTDGCNKKVVGRGFCVACYYRKLRHGEFKVGSPTIRSKHRLTQINSESKTAICSNCGLVKIVRRDTKSWRCSILSNEKSKLYKQAYRQSKLDQLDNKCAVCNTTEDLCWDHEHQSGKFRGTLCNTCNLAIGLLKDNPQFCVNAANYLVGFNMADFVSKQEELDPEAHKILYQNLWSLYD